nr:DUF320 domain-containing protein [Nocardiopsis mwathae]
MKKSLAAGAVVAASAGVLLSAAPASAVTGVTAAVPPVNTVIGNAPTPGIAEGNKVGTAVPGGAPSETGAVIAALKPFGVYLGE